MNKLVKLQFRGKINGLMQQSSIIRNKIIKSSGSKRAGLWTEKRILGQFTRHVMLAYAYLRGLEYNRVEKKIANYNHPDTHLVYLIVQSTLQIYSREFYPGLYTTKKHTLKDVEEWFTFKKTHCFFDKPYTLTKVKQ